MGALDMLTLLVTHPNEFRVLVQFYLWHDSKRDITSKSEHATSGWDRESMRRCWELLDMTSRSFSAVIKELDGDLARMVSTFKSLFFSRLIIVVDLSVLPRTSWFGHNRG